MKKALVLVLSFLFMSGAFASKARLLALGDDKDGSFFIDDFRNMFLNAAYVNNHKDQVFLEWGGTGSSNLDLDNNQKAMGGFLMSSGSLVYGLYVGNESDTDSLLRQTANPAAVNTVNFIPTVDNITDFFIGGEASGIKWGANVLYSKNENEANKQEDDRYAVRLGVIKGDLEAFANISLGNEAKDSDGGTSSTEAKFDGSSGYHVGGAYRIGDFTPYVSFKDGSWDNINNDIKTEGTFTEIKVGVGHTKEITSTMIVFSRLNYFSEDVELKYASLPSSAKITRIPLTFGIEASATSWLTLRGSVSANLHGKRKTQNLTTPGNATTIALLRARYNGSQVGAKDETIQNSTVVSAGATLNFGKLSVDGMIGNAGPDGDASGATGNNVGTLSLDRLMTRVAMTYSF